MSPSPRSSQAPTAAAPRQQQRNTPYLPTPTELALLAGYPALLLFGALFSLISPETRAAPYDALRHAHSQDPALSPSYFARKDNLFNVLFVKRGWAWISLAFFAFMFTHPALVDGVRRTRAGLRWVAVTVWWVFVTQWFFGPAIIDRGFRWTGGKCDVVVDKVYAGEADVGEVFTAAACKSTGGKWSGGHDISGHVFLLVLGSFFLVQEVGWVAARWARVIQEERSVVMYDGAVKGAGTEAERREHLGAREEDAVSVVEALGRGGGLAAGVIGLSGWMLLMTAIYFHTWFEKVSLPPRTSCLQQLLTSIPTRRVFSSRNSSRLYIPTMSSTPTDMAPIKVPSDLPGLVRTAFSKARASGDVNFYPTQVALLDINSIPFQLRFSPALANKPKPKPNPPDKPPFDPFDNPSPTLLITPLLPAHLLVLNKFAIVPEHFILATRTFQPQTHLLAPADLAATHACIAAYHSAAAPLFAFFNSGEHSGASQPHRHIQLLPVARMEEGLDAGHGWGVLAERMVDPAVCGKLPFAAFAGEIAPGMDGDRLRGVYLDLYRQACTAVGVEGGGEEGEGRISYNMAMTREVMVVVPRVAEGAMVTALGRGDVIGKLALNGTLLAGTALVKSQAEWDALREDPGQVVEVLKRIGVPNQDDDRGPRSQGQEPPGKYRGA
ncbi:inositol phospholipid synthesis and fat-storage-inducing TM-domain-containing protein [Lasiosphaeria hispida]|uniref:Inositol phospholipid synthesis and fat-storage-inducing TM-domain-containing protein n=1 Tax=Lasiosphaeria hispida TaxID=260671 RepID=A0AAJ0MGP8_9PEZI|nr:inositol phospholipid synthesis and fat-storage-inducing TM-domain-containing protein [Lasiosphaeria hispida]